jgi:hypothetical protein
MELDAGELLQKAAEFTEPWAFPAGYLHTEAHMGGIGYEVVVEGYETASGEGSQCALEETDARVVETATAESGEHLTDRGRPPRPGMPSVR